MRAGACALQQTLTSEAASVLKQSLNLARRRGHPQVTPLHVAATLLSSRISLLRRACHKSQPPHQASHPLQCRALELCFNVALNRLPTTPGPLLHGQPSLSNALIAALKRAQAHQRRGCIEQQQQQPLLAIKVDIEQLIFSILDDPSVSRVMREAGFSSTAVKNNLEDSSTSSVFHCYNSSGGVYSTPNSPPTEGHREVINPGSFWQTHFSTCSSAHNPFFFSPQKKLGNYPAKDSTSVTEDIKFVLEVLMGKKKKNIVVVGDSSTITEGLVQEVMAKVENGDVQDLKSVRFIKFQFSSVPLRYMKRGEVELNLADLKKKVDSLISRGGVIIYTGDLKWAVGDTNIIDEKEGGFSNEASGNFSPVDHLVAEIGKLLSEYSVSNTKVWLMATANYQTYMRCQMKNPPLEIQWSLQAVSVPSAGLCLSLNATSVHDSRLTFSHNPTQMLEERSFVVKEEQDVLTCCKECTFNYEKEAGLVLKTAQQQKPSLYINLEEGSKQLPYWLQPHEKEAHQKDDLVELKQKWNRLCHTLHQGKHTQNHVNSSSLNNQGLIERSYSNTSAYPLWPNQDTIFADSNSISVADSTLKPNHAVNSIPRFRRQQSCHIEFNFSHGNDSHEPEPSLDCLKSREGKEITITLTLGNSMSTDAGTESKLERAKQNEDICKVLQDNVPWQAQVIPSIVEALIDQKSIKKQIWLLFQGNDLTGKRRLALSIAESVFGSSELLFCMNMRNKEKKTRSYSEVLERAMRNHAKLVILVENVDFADAQFVKFLANGFETGNFGEMSTKFRSSRRVIFILTESDTTSSEDGEENQKAVIQMSLLVTDTETSIFDHKRKGEWDLPNKVKCREVVEKIETSFVVSESGNIEKEFSRQLSTNTLDLNLIAAEEHDKDEKQVGCSPVSSDLTGENSDDHKNPLGFIELIKDRFVLNQDSTKDGQIRERFMSRIRGAFLQVMGSEQRVSFTVDHSLVEEIVLGSGSFLNSLFEKWLKENFQTSLQNVKIGGKRAMNIRLFLGGSGSSDVQDGFFGSCLPKRIQVSLG